MDQVSSLLFIIFYMHIFSVFPHRTICLSLMILRALLTQTDRA